MVSEIDAIKKDIRKYEGGMAEIKRLRDALKKDVTQSYFSLDSEIKENEIVELKKHFPTRTRPTTLAEKFQRKGKEVRLTPVLGSGQSEAYVYACLILNAACNAKASHISMVPLDGLVNISYTINGQPNQMPSYPKIGSPIKDYEGLHAEIINGLKKFVGLGSIADIQAGTGEVSIRGVPYKMIIGTAPTQYGLKVDIKLEKRVS